MGIDNIQATKYFDEIRTYLGKQTSGEKSVELSFLSRRSNHGVEIVIVDLNNPESQPYILMSNIIGTGRRWSNEARGEVFNIVNEILIDFDKQKILWGNQNYEFTLQDAEDFILGKLKEVSSYLR